MPRVSRLLAQSLVLDLRSLALMRIALGAILIADLAIRAPDLALFYSDVGAVPLAFLQGPHYSLGFSFHLLHGSTAFQALLFVVAGLAAAALMVGWRTRLFAAVSWLMLLSLQHRNTFLLQGGDMLLAAALFWGLFLPWGRRFSVDALRSGAAPAPASNTYVGVPGAAWIGQICILYAFSVLIKHGPQWREEGTAIAYVLQAGQYNTALAHLALGAPPALLRGLTFGVLALEAIVPVVLLLPWRQGVPRTVILLLVSAMHAGIGATLAIGLFPVISIVTLVGLFPPGAWAFAGRLRPGRALARATVAFEIWMRRRLKAEAKLPSKTTLPSRFARLIHRTVAAVCVTAFALVLACNTQSVWPWRMPPLAWAPAALLRLNQYWNLFAPQAGQDTWWHVVRGQLAGGRTVDLFRGGKELTYDEPAVSSRLYPNQRWVKFMDALGGGHMEPCRQAWLDHLCREWNAQHGGADRLRSAEIVFLARPIRLDDVRQPPRMVVLGTRTCQAASQPPIVSRGP